MFVRLKSYFAYCLPGRVKWLPVVLAYWYLAAYVLMMDWRSGAVDPVSGAWVSGSHYRMAHMEDLGGQFGCKAAYASCWANRVFAPIDRLVDWVITAANIMPVPRIVLENRVHYPSRLLGLNDRAPPPQLRAFYHKCGRITLEQT